MIFAETLLIASFYAFVQEMSFGIRLRCPFLKMKTLVKMTIKSERHRCDVKGGVRGGTHSDDFGVSVSEYSDLQDSYSSRYIQVVVVVVVVVPVPVPILT